MPTYRELENRRVTVIGNSNNHGLPIGTTGICRNTISEDCFGDCLHIEGHPIDGNHLCARDLVLAIDNLEYFQSEIQKAESILNDLLPKYNFLKITGKTDFKPKEYKKFMIGKIVESPYKISTQTKLLLKVMEL